MTDIRTLKVISGGPEPVSDLIKTLEGLLEQARTGELQALAYCTVRASGKIGTGWNGGAGTRFPLGSAVAILAVRYANGMAGDGE